MTTALSMMGLAASPGTEVEPTCSTWTARPPSPADAGSLAIEQYRPVRIGAGQRDRGVVWRDLVQPEALDVLIADQARAVRLRRRLHGLRMASAQNYLNRPKILAGPARNNGPVWAGPSSLSDPEAFALLGKMRMKVPSPCAQTAR
jgi:hypothetical protein